MDLGISGKIAVINGGSAELEIQFFKGVKHE